MMQGTETVWIERRFCGPPGSANGGYVCGLLARRITGPALIRLRRPPPLARELLVRPTEAGLSLCDGRETIAEARAADAPLLDVPQPPALRDVEAAARGYAGFRRHAFPGCFVCGTARADGDGLRLFAGPVPGADGVLACPWTPQADLAGGGGRVHPEFLWAALDCPGYWAVSGEAGIAVLGTLHGELIRPVESGRRAMVAAWPLKRAGRRHEAGTAIFDSAGRLCARARAVWLTVDPKTFGAVA